MAEVLQAAGLSVERTRHLRQSLQALRSDRPDLLLLRPLVGSGQAELRALTRRAPNPWSRSCW